MDRKINVCMHLTNSSC